MPAAAGGGRCRAHSNLAQQPFTSWNRSQRDWGWLAGQFVADPLFTGVDCSALQVLTIIQGSPASQLMGIGESGQRAPLIEIGDIIVKVRSLDNVIESRSTVTFVKVNSLFVPMQAPDSTISRGPLTLSIRKRSGRTLSVIVERGPSFS